MGKKRKKRKYEGIEKVTIDVRHNSLKIEVNPSSDLKIYDDYGDDVTNEEIHFVDEYIINNLVASVWNEFIERYSHDAVDKIVDEAIKACEDDIQRHVQFIPNDGEYHAFATKDEDVLRYSLSLVISYISKAAPYLLVNTNSLNRIQMDVGAAVKGKIYRYKNGIPEKKEE